MKSFKKETWPQNLYILAYHHVCNDWLPTAARVTVRQFEKHIQTLKGEDVLFLSEKDLLSPENLPSEKKKVLLTFDDGFSCLYRNAFPILQKYNVAALIFIVTGYVGQFSAWDVNFFSKKPRHLNWEEIEEMHRHGISFGSHSHTHIDLKGVHSLKIQEEARNSKFLLENKLGSVVHSISYPFGRHSGEVEKIASESGYSLGFTLNPGTNCVNPLAIPRFGVYLFDIPFFFHLKMSTSPLRHLEYTKLKVTNFCSKGTIWTKRILG